MKDVTKWYYIQHNIQSFFDMVMTLGQQGFHSLFDAQLNDMKWVWDQHSLIWLQAFCHIFQIDMVKTFLYICLVE